MLTLRQLRHFIAVAEAGSISGAAQATFVAQSSLTLAVQQLEDELDAPLFERHAKGMTLTHQGHQFLRQANLILATVDNAKFSVKQGMARLSGNLTLGVTSLVSGYFLVDMLTRFRACYPDVTVNIIEDERRYIEHLLVNGEIDIGVLILSNLEDRHALQTEVLVHSPYRLWLPPLHPLLEQEAISLNDAAAYPLVQLNADEMDRHARQIWANAGLQPCIAMRTASTEAVRSMVAAGLGVSIQPDMAYRPWSLEGSMIEARQLSDLNEHLNIGLAWRRGNSRPELVTPFLALAREKTSGRKVSI